MRRASFEGLRSIETFALDHDFAETLRLRNRFARRLSFLDFYDYKVWWAEGFDKATLFNLLDDLETRTRAKASAELQDLERRLGQDALEPWNLNYHTWGSVQEEREPYFGFEDSVERWARTFAAMGVRYRNARVTLDLLDRRGKFENGFMHGPGPAYFRQGEWSPAEINFTANAVPGQVGSGQRAAETLFHEGGHAAHFANILMDAPCFSQEFAPTSVALAETQSMFMDRLLEDADWQTRYAKDAQGRPMPFDLIERTIRLTHPYEAQNIRHLLTVCYVEKALYETDDAQLKPEKILSIIRDVERRLVQIPGGCPRPTLSVPHLLSWEASGYYHGYVLAMMAVSQTRKHFFGKYGYIVDNPQIGPEMGRVY
ncbi:MAG TPA: M3 family metallopeptidase, partial [bacterium]|nr:M3 family metallopeptidase [bacterium]